MRSRFIATFFAFFFGWFGLNNFYTRSKVFGVLDIFMDIFGICLGFKISAWGFALLGLVWFINFVRGISYLFVDSDEEFDKGWCAKVED